MVVKTGHLTEIDLCFFELRLDVRVSELVRIVPILPTISEKGSKRLNMADHLLALPL